MDKVAGQRGGEEAVFVVSIRKMWIRYFSRVKGHKIDYYKS